MPAGVLWVNGFLGRNLRQREHQIPQRLGNKRARVGYRHLRHSFYRGAGRTLNLGDRPAGESSGQCEPRQTPYRPSLTDVNSTRSSESVVRTKNAALPSPAPSGVPSMGGVR